MHPTPLEKPKQLSVAQWRQLLEEAGDPIFNASGMAFEAGLLQADMSMFWRTWTDCMERTFLQVINSHATDADQPQVLRKRGVPHVVSVSPADRAKARPTIRD